MEEVSINVPKRPMSYRSVMESYANHLLDLLKDVGVVDKDEKYDVDYYTATFIRGVRVLPAEWKALEPCLFNVEYNIRNPGEVKINTPTLISTVKINQEQADRALEYLLKKNTANH